MDQVVEKVSQDSRRNGRVPVNRLLDDLEIEREQLVLEKKKIEFELTRIEDWRRNETAKIISKRMSKSLSIEATTQLESDARKKKAVLLKDKQTVEIRLHDIKSKLLRTFRQPEPKGPREDVVVLIRIEKLLIELLSKFNSKSK